MVILLWVAAGIIAANIVFGVVLLARFRSEEQRAAEARRRREAYVADGMLPGTTIPRSAWTDR